MQELLGYFLSYNENLNLSLQFIVEQMGKDSTTGEVGAKYKILQNS